MVDLRRVGGLLDDDWWVAIYWMLSRTRRLNNLILLGLTEQVAELLQRGPPTQLVAVTSQLETRAKETLAKLASQ